MFNITASFTVDDNALVFSCPPIFIFRRYDNYPGTEGYRKMQDNLFGLQAVSLGAAVAVKVPIYNWLKYTAASLVSIGQPAYAQDSVKYPVYRESNLDKSLEVRFNYYHLTNRK